MYNGAKRCREIRMKRRTRVGQRKVVAKKWKKMAVSKMTNRQA